MKQKNNAFWIDVMCHRNFGNARLGPPWASPFPVFWEGDPSLWVTGGLVSLWSKASFLRQCFAKATAPNVSPGDGGWHRTWPFQPEHKLAWRSSVGKRSPIGVQELPSETIWCHFLFLTREDSITEFNVSGAISYWKNVSQFDEFILTVCTNFVNPSPEKIQALM